MRKQANSSLMEFSLEGAPSSQQQIAFLALWAINSLFLLILSTIFKNNVVLGNEKVPTALAAVIAGFVICVLTFMTKPILKKIGFSTFDENLSLLVYLAVSFVGVWVLKRLANLTGLGISNLLFVLVVAIVSVLAVKLVGFGIDWYLKKI